MQTAGKSPSTGQTFCYRYSLCLGFLFYMDHPSYYGMEQLHTK
ncbi:unnamed protein product [Staurois parvus]|uniref:Uncharacterized protein n=1 Tax=Staurois parvus TaxID=386267 RepID=A0ABN9G108_9NEOB|nr:unnamed protein product [Staurois parvus]